MFHLTITPFFSMVALFLIIVDPSISRPLSHQAGVSKSAFSHHRFLRRSTPSLSSSSHRRRSLDEQQDEFLPFGPISLVDDESENFKRSINPDLDEPQDDPSFDSIDQEKDDADKAWQQFVAPTPDEDPDSYPDSFAQDDASDSSCSTGTNASNVTPKNSPKLVASNDKNKVKSSSSQDAGDYKPQKPKDSGSDKPKDSEASKKKEAEAAQQKEAEAAKQKEDEAAKQKEDEAAKQKEAEAAQQKEAEAAKEKEAEANKEKKAEEDKKKAEEQKKKDADAAKKQADQANGAEEAKDQQAVQQPSKSQDGTVTDVQPIPGTSVTTGTVHKDHKGDSYSTPSAEVHTGDATYYQPDLGACGLTNTSSDMIVAVSKLLYDSFPSQGGNPNTNQVCGKRIRATYKGKSCEVTVVDRCEGCKHDDLDFTITAFEKLGSKDEGRLHGMTWTFI
ncbi:hypothetical protein PGT21_028002 [Puccinia graminis f. sp. tritici]|uniref:RlpA-like protein double-psi beta-barrel domain-containing protein n=1 Tax=Puccinia graminis f. sp. tritici TaxID=56615 RepID=A0A5B0S126_PUCGR|nr:hypothetical protein PGT21_028002 [Puccinia graminis f. sp. tritici]KAA1131189.1 hypothetical protein PGTUg99_022619 [Puccinia graminis f. sp. tritici]